LRAAIRNAIEHSPNRRAPSAEEAGLRIIDNLGKLDGRALHVLQVAFSDLVKASASRR
jgi:hypothetical protein